MRWDNLFDDLEGQLEHELSADESDARAEVERLRLGRLSLRSRLAGLSGATGGTGPLAIRLALVSGETILVRPVTFGRDWLAGDLVTTDAPWAGAESRASAAMCVLPFASIAAVVLQQDQISDSLDGEVESAERLIDRIGLAFVLRDLCRRRKTLLIRTATGDLTGTLDRVGRDHVDLAVHPADALRRMRSVQEIRIVPLVQIRLVLLR